MKKMWQANLRNVQLWLGLLLLVACGGAADVTPTPIGQRGEGLNLAEGGATVLSTPTLTGENLPTPAAVLETAVPIQNGLTIGDPYIPELGSSHYDVRRYTLRLALDPDVRRINGEATIEAVSLESSLSEVALDFIGFSVDGVTLDGTAVSFRRENNKLIITLPQTLGENNPMRLVVRYSGEPPVHVSNYVRFTELGLTYRDGYVFTLTEPDGARAWFPANDHPRDKAQFRFELTVPAGLTAVANGLLLEEAVQPLPLPEPQASETFVWQHDHQMAPYLAIVAVGEYERVEETAVNGVNIRHYIAPDVREKTDEALIITADALRFFENQFGPYPFEAFGIVTVPAGATALETQTMSLMGYEVIGKQTLVHELAHMWFGNHVSIDSWAQMWWKEGMATYATSLWNNRGDAAQLDTSIDGVAAAVAINEPQYPIGNPPPDLLLAYNTYFKGAVTWHRLRQELGDDAFFAALRQISQQHGDGTLSQAEFEAILLENGGGSGSEGGGDLRPFFVEWLE